MKPVIAVLAVAMLAGCGVDTATTAATGAAVKKQEAQEGKRMDEAVRQKLEQATEQAERARQSAEPDGR